MSVPGWQLGRPKSVDDLVLSLGRLQSWLDLWSPRWQKPNELYLAPGMFAFGGSATLDDSFLKVAVIRCPTAVDSYFYYTIPNPAGWTAGAVRVTLLWSGDTSPGSDEVVRLNMYISQFAVGDDLNSTPSNRVGNHWEEFTVPSTYTADSLFVSVVDTTHEKPMGHYPMFTFRGRRTGTHANDDYSGEVNIEAVLLEKV